ncbi:MAG: hypothetical protein ACR2ML_01905 [Solirubrobacteraceae bacterium]
MENISIAGAALGIRDDLRVLLRAGRGEIANETRSLFKLGTVRDVNRIGGTLLAAAALGSEAKEAFLHEQTVYLVFRDGEIEPFDDGDTERDGEETAGGDGAPAAPAGDE